VSLVVVVGCAIATLVVHYTNGMPTVMSSNGVRCGVLCTLVYAQCSVATIDKMMHLVFHQPYVHMPAYIAGFLLARHHHGNPLRAHASVGVLGDEEECLADDRPLARLLDLPGHVPHGDQHHARLCRPSLPAVDRLHLRHGQSYRVGVDDDHRAAQGRRQGACPDSHDETVSVQSIATPVLEERETRASPSSLLRSAGRLVYTVAMIEPVLMLAYFYSRMRPLFYTWETMVGRHA